MRPKERSRILILLSGLIVLSLSLIVYLSYFIIFEAEAVKKHPANRRASIVESEIQRGSIYDCNGEVLAYSEGEPGNYTRINNFPNLYSHIIGYSHPSLGKSGLESSYNDYLLNRNGNQTLKQMSNFLRDDKKMGNNLVLTIDTRVQSKARDLLSNAAEKGSIVLMNPKTGEIYAMVSLPDYNVMTISEDWDSINQSKDGVLLNRSISGAYPPGSTFKIITAAALLENKDIKQSYLDEGVQVINGREFSNAGGKEYGSVNLKAAFSYSLNTYFVSKGVELGQQKLGSEADKFMFNQKIPFDLKVKNSIFDYSKRMDNTKLAASSIGQGDVLATPLNMAMVASAVANEGKMQKPILVSRVEDPKGATIWENKKEVLKESLTPEIAEELKDLMIAVVREGNGGNASLRNYQVAGKTGTAENASGKNHAWFVGFAPANDPELAVAVIIEESGSTGGKAAAPVARDLILYAKNNLNFEKSTIKDDE